MIEDSRYVYGAGCTWHGSIHEVGTNGVLPCCPFCKGILFELRSKKIWDDSVEEFDKTHPNYKAMLDWAKEQNRCFNSIDSLILAFKKATGKEVKLNVYGNYN